MPTVPVINTAVAGYSTKDYVPLDDPVEEIAASPTTAINGSVVYSKSLSRGHGHSRGSSQYGSGSAGGSRWIEEEDGDIGAVRYKGKERARDEEPAAAQSPTSTSFSHSYPPLSQEEEEERRVQANLAKFTARETARRKAARASRVFPSQTESGRSSASSSTTSLPRSRLSSIQGTVKRSSVFGNLLHKGKGSRSNSTSSSQSHDITLPSTSGANAQTAYPNPYDSPGESDPLKSPTSAATSPTDANFKPSMKMSSPFADPGSAAQSSGQWDSPAQSPTTEGNVGYQGQNWRGGAAVAEQTATPPKKEKWWHALCAWGNDLDGGHGSRSSNQAGRTNPFE